MDYENDEFIRFKNNKGVVLNSERGPLNYEQKFLNNEDKDHTISLGQDNSQLENKISKIIELKDNSNNTIISAHSSHISQEYIKMEKIKLRSIMEILKKSYEEEKKRERRNEIVIEAKKKIFRIAKLLNTKNMFLKAIKNDKDEKEGSFFIMHPELSNFRIFIDSIIIACILYDSLYSPYKYFVEKDKEKILETREIIIDCLLTFDIISTFFTGFFKNQVLITDFKSIFLNYIKLKFICDTMYVIPFSYIKDYLYFLRMIKLYKFSKILKRIRYILVKLFNLCIKSLKLIHSITNILIFTISLIYIIHYSACIFVYIGKIDDSKGWVKKNDILGFDNKTESTEIYIASLHLLMETFTTIGYGEINPKTTLEVLFLMICEVLNVGLFAYLISCIMDIITRMSTDEISFKIKTDVDINSWLLKYNNKVPELNKIKMEKENNNLFEEVKRYFLLFYKNDNLWIKNFDFLKQMRPDIRRDLLNHSFYSFFTLFNFFFSQLEDSFKFTIALNLKSKIIEKNELIISENPDSYLNKFKYIYLIGHGTVNIVKDDIKICRFDKGSYFGDEYFITNSAKFTYLNASNHENLYLFCCPISVINELCSYYEESYVMMLIKTLIRFARIREMAESLGIRFTDKNNDFFKKIRKPKQNNKIKSSITKIIDITEETIRNDIVIENFQVKKSPADLNNEIKEINTPKDAEPKNTPPYINSDEYKGNHNQIFSKDEHSVLEDNIENISLPAKHNEEKENLRQLNDNKIQEEEEDIFDNLEFLDKIEINEENMGEMMRLNSRANKLKNYHNYQKKLVKKLSFLEYQVDFLKNHYESLKTKSDKMIGLIDSNNPKFFN